jgi:uncharacterized membrane protein
VPGTLTAEGSPSRSREAARLLLAERIDYRLLLGGILALAVVLRFIDISSPLSMDDAFSYLVGSAGNSHLFLTRLAGSENTPPLFYLLLAPLPLGHAAWLRVPAAVPGALMCLALGYMLKPRLGPRAALIAALAVAVSPFLVTYSNLSRGFMLEDLCLLVVLWAALKLAEGGSARWWLLYLAASVLALYSEYDAAVFLLALTATLCWLAPPPSRARVAALGALPLLALAPWIPEIVRAQHAVNRTKLDPTFPAPSLTTLRDAAATLTLGEHGGTEAGAGRWLELVALAGLAAMAVVLLRRAAPRIDSVTRRTVALVAGTAGLTVIGHAIAGAAGIDLFNQRYLTILIPLAAALGAAALVATGRTPLLVAVSLLLVALGVVGAIRRYHNDYAPSLAPVRAATLALHPRSVLTNTPVVLYYMSSFRPQLDRPFNLGRGRAQSCARPCLIIDDLAIRTGRPRRITGTPMILARQFELVLER